MSPPRAIYPFRADPGETATGDAVDAAAKLEALRASLGGKGAGLHVAAELGFRVPAGFTISSAWCEAYFENDRRLSAEFLAEMQAAVNELEETVGKKLGAERDPLLVAVRSGAAESMPGMMDTVLNVASLERVREAVEQVFLSWTSDRAIAYRRERGIVGLAGTAATVQEMCPAEVAGVAFTLDPRTAERVVVVEAIRGLGEDLVSGEVTPDRFRLRPPSLDLVDCEAAHSQPVLSDEQVRGVARLAVEVQDRFGYPVDIEWAIAGGEIYLLQVRAIRRADVPAAVKSFLEREIRPLLQASRPRERSSPAAGDETAFVRYNLDETLTYPTPMTWDFVRDLFRGPDGFLGLYIDLGFQPSPRVLEEGFLVRLGGRIYADISRAAEIFYGTADIVRYDPEKVRENPDLLNEPPARWESRAVTPAKLFRTVRCALRSQRRIETLRDSFEEHFVRETLPHYLQWCREKKAQDLSLMQASELLEELRERVAEVFRRFPRHALKLSFLAGMAYSDLREFLERRAGDVDGSRAAQTLVGHLAGDLAVEQNRQLAQVARGELTREAFLETYGHRSAHEMELARPRWWEDVEAVDRMAKIMDDEAASRFERRFEASGAAVQAEEDRMLALVQESGGQGAVGEFRVHLERARRLLPWRESWKFHWMVGVDLVRRTLVELDRQLGLEGMIFYLDHSGLTEIVEAGGALGDEHRAVIRSRREDERLARSLDLPEFLTRSDLERIAREGSGSVVMDREATASPTGELRGTPIASGRGTARAWICRDPDEECPFSSPYLLVCRSTDPGWTPLLARAQGLIVERGGALSHGAIVCRDFGVPAVVLPDAVERLNQGELLRIDGGSGVVARLADEDGAGESGEDTGEAPTPVEELVSREPHVAPVRPRLGRRVAIGLVELIPAEPHVAPVRPRLGRRVAIGLVLAVALSVVILGTPAIASALSPLLALAFDWTLEAGLTPFWCIFWVAAISAGLSTSLAVAIVDRRQLRAMRVRLKWYRRQLKRLKILSKSAVAPPSKPPSSKTPSSKTPPSCRDIPAALATLRRRQRQATAERSLELLRPIVWSFLPFCLAFIWVQERFPSEPIRPGDTFDVHCYLRPGPGDNYLRYVRLDLDPARSAPPSLRLLDDAYQRVVPNRDHPAFGPYRASWSVQARREGLARIAVTARNERMERDLLVTKAREFAVEEGRRFEARPRARSREILALEAEYPAVQVELPSPVFKVFNRVAAVFGGGGLRPEQAASGPPATFVVLAIILALFFQRILGVR